MEGDLQRFTGHYVSASDGEILNVFTKGRALKATFGDGESLDFVHHEGGMFTLKYKLLGFLPLPVDELKDIRIHTVDHAKETQFRIEYGYIFEIVGSQLTPVKPVPIPEIWKDAVGNYRYINASRKERELVRSLDEEFLKLEWNEENGFLFLAGRPVRPINNHFAVFMGAGRNLGETIELLPDGRLFYAGFRFVRE